MSDTESTKNLGRDALGIALFGLAVFAAISVVMSMAQPVEAPGGTTALVGAFVGFLGGVPGVVLSLALAWLGSQIWLGGREHGLVRDLLGVVGVTLGLSITAGAAVAGAGGWLGGVTGGTVASFMTPFVGVPFGVACLLIPVWFAWVRPADLISWKVGKTEDRPAAGDTESEGVSVAEAEALMPRIPAPPERRTIEEAAEAPTPLPPLYPPDVRLEGKVPEGAQPLQSTDVQESQQAHAEDAALSERAPDPVRGAPLAPGADLVAEAGPGPQAPARPAAASPSPGAAPATPAGEVAPPRTRAAAAEVQPIRSGHLPPASWEQPSLYEEEPVDAYGTPRSLVDAITGEPSTPDAGERALADRDASALVAEPEEEEEAETEAEDVEYASEDAEEDEDGEELEEDEDEDDVEYASDEDDEEADDDEEEYEEDEEEEDGAYASEDGDEDEEDEEEEYEDEEEEDLAQASEDADEDEELADEEPEEEEAVAAEASADEEPQVELQPAAPPAARSDEGEFVEPDPESLSGAELLHKAGNLFLARGRVAVSMLQREFGLDFKQATVLLDQLQEAGLIGPYMGGKRRDILLTAEEWQERVGAL